MCGLAAITVVTSHVPNHTQIDLAFYAALLIFLGMVFDVLDGHIARMTKQTSQFGKELDSLCDVITFGVAPVFIMFTYSDVFQRRLLWGIGVLYAVAAILRLARFNVQKDEHAPTELLSGVADADGGRHDRVVRDCRTVADRIDRRVDAGTRRRSGHARSTPPRWSSCRC